MVFDFSFLNDGQRAGAWIASSKLSPHSLLRLYYASSLVLFIDNRLHYRSGLFILSVSLPASPFPSSSSSHHNVRSEEEQSLKRRSLYMH